MNKTFHSIWNASKQAWVAAAETVSAKGKPTSGVKVAAVLAGLMGSLLGTVANAQTAPPPTPTSTALPTSGQVSAGQASISQSGAHMVINQSTQRAAINWQTFNVGKDAHVQFQQPSAASVTLNRVMSSDPSQIFGRISANGQVVLTNPAGVYFGKDARVDVGGLVATTMGVSDADFMAGKSRFERNGSNGSVVNEGELKAALGGYIALLAPEVRNQGAVIAHMGTVSLAAGEAIDLKFDSNNRLTSLRVEPSQIAALVENRHAVQAPGGLVIISAQSMDRLVGGVVKNSGRIEANGLQQQGGRIVLSASTKVDNTGSISANATAEGPAGKVEISAPEVTNSGSISATGNAAYNAGSVLVQATNFTQAATGSIDLSAPQQGGLLSIQTTGHAQLQGNVNAQATQDRTPEGTTTQGGQIDIAAQGDVEVNNAMLDASGGQGGTIALRAKAPTQPDNPNPMPDAPGQGRLAIMGNSTLSTRGRSGNGGSTTLLGDHIELLGTTAIDATGATGGGKVLVGGDWQGGNGVYQATTVTMAEGTSIDASATDNGKGGTVVLWSNIERDDSVTRAHGSIQAQGGTLGGDGGWVETSGHGLSINHAYVSTMAPKGKTGEWLLDPGNISISTTSASVTSISGSSFEASNGATYTVIHPDAITNALNWNNLTITTGTGNYALLVNSPINHTGYGNTLTLQAAVDLQVSQPITSTGSIRLIGENIYPKANLTSTGWGKTISLEARNNIDVNATLSINTNNGNVYLWADSDGNKLGNYWQSGLTVNPGSGDVSIRANWILQETSVINGTGKLTVEPSSNSFYGAIWPEWFTPSPTLTGLSIGSLTNANDIWVYNQPLTINGSISLMGNTVTLRHDVTSTGNGDLLFHGNAQGWSFDLYSGKSIIKSAGTGTLTIQGNGRLGNSTSTGNIQATGTGKLNVVMIAEIDGRDTYGVSTGSITTNGGHVWIGGGAKTATWNGLQVGSAYAWGGSGGNAHGVDVTGNISTSNGDVLIAGRTKDGSHSDIAAVGATRTITTGSGDITLLSRSSRFGTGSSSKLNLNTIGTLSLAPLSGLDYGLVDLTVTGSTSSNTFTGTGDLNGLVIQNTHTLGGLTLGNYLGTGRGGDTPYNYQNTAITDVDSPLTIGGSVRLYGSLVTVSQNITTTSNGEIYLQGTGTANTDGIRLASGRNITLSSGSGNITLQGDNLAFDGLNLSSGNTTTTINTTGVLTLRPHGNAFTANTLAGSDGGSGTTLDWTGAFNGTTWEITKTQSADADFRGLRITGFTSLGGLVLQKPGVSTPVNIQSQFLGTGGVSVNGGNINVNAAVDTGNFSLTSSGTVTQTAPLNVTNLSLNGSGSYSLNHTSNSIGYLAANTYNGVRIGSLSLTNSGALTIGTVNSSSSAVVYASGIWSSGAVFVNTLSGNLTLAQAVNTTNASTSAIRLAAGTSASRGGDGSPGTGNIIISGSPTLAAGSGGRIALYTGSVSDSTGLTSLVGSGTGRFRYNTSIYASGVETAGYTTALSANDVHAIYRENITVAGNVDNKSITYGDSYTLTGTSITGLANGDTPAIAIEGVLRSTSSQVRVGSYQLNASSLAGLGYSGSIGKGTLTVSAKTLTLTSFAAANKTYDGTASATISNPGTLSGLVGTDSVTVSNTGATFSDRNAGTSKNVTLSGIKLNSGNINSDAGNYTITNTATTTANITALGITLTAEAKSKTYGNADPALTYTASTALVGGDSFTGALTRAPGQDAGTYAITQGTLAINDGNSGNNYAVTYVSNNLTIGKRAITLAASSVSKTYGDADPTLGVTVTSGNLASVAGGHTGNDSLADVAGTLTRASGENVGSYNVALGTGAKAGNYDITFVTSNNALTISKRDITLAATPVSKTYGDADPTLAVSISAGSLGSTTVSDSLAEVTGTLTRASGQTSQDVGSYDVALGTGSKAGNYSISFAKDNNALTITKRPITLTATPVSKVYGDADPTLSVTVTAGSLASVAGGHTSNDNLADVTGTLSREAGSNVGTYDVLLGTGSTVGSKAGNYEISFVDTNKALSITPKTVSLSAIKEYDGTANLTGKVSIFTGVGSETLTYTGATANDAHVTTAKYISRIELKDGTGGLASNYQLPATLDATTAPVTITPATLTLSLSNTAVTKVYDGTTSAPTGFTPSWTLSGFVSGDTAAAITITGMAYNSKDVASANTLTVSGLGIASVTGDKNSRPTDYQLDSASKSVAATITPAPLTVTVNNDARFVAQASDTAGYAGVSVTGFVNGESITSLGAGYTAPTVARSTQGPDGNTSGANTLAGIYTGQLTASGGSATNYSITTYNAGTYTIVPSNQLLVRATNVIDTYGTSTTYSITSASYWDPTVSESFPNGKEILLTPTVNFSNSFTVADGAAGAATFTLAPINPLLSRASKLQVGSYQLGATNVSKASDENFSNTLTIVGSHQVKTKALTASATGVSKVYDGNISVTNGTLGLSGVEGTDSNKDEVTVSGVGVYTDKNASNSASYTYSNLKLAGDDSANYHLVGGASITGTGLIQAKQITSLSATKVYDGTTTLSGSQVSFVGLVDGETMSYTGATANDAHVATLGNYISAITLGDSNYVLPAAVSGSYGSVTITPAKLTPTLSNSNVTKVYDGTTSAPTGFTPTWTFSGLVSGDTTAALNNTGTAYNDANVLTANKVTVSGLSITSITGSNSSQATDYVLDASSKSVAATISKASLTVTADDLTRVYGDNNPTFTQTIAGYVLVNGLAENATTAGVTGDASASTTATATSNVGNYTITNSVGTLSAANYSFTAANGSLTVTARPVTVSTDASQGKIYGDADPALAYTVAADAGVASTTSRGLANGETLKGSLSRAAGENAGTYAIGQNTLTNANNPNYSITWTGADFTIAKRAITLTANAVSKAYGDADPTVSVAISSGTLGSVTVSDTLGDLTGTVTREAGNNAGSYDVLLGIASAKAANYDITFDTNNNAFTIDRKTVTLSASKVYDGSDSLTGFVTIGTGVGSETLTYSGATANSKHVTLATHISGITLQNATDGSGGLESNYKLPATLDATTAPVTITARALTPTLGNAQVSKVYDGTTASGSFTPQWNFSGLVDGDTSATLTSTSTIFNDHTVAGASALVITGLGISGVTGNNGSLPSDYALSVNNQSVAASITRAPLTVTADDKTRMYGEANPTFTQTISGYVNNENATSAGVSGAATATATSLSSSVVGSYTISASTGTLSADNYQFVAVDGSLSITKRPLAVSANAAQSKVYGDADPVLTYTVAGNTDPSSRGLVGGDTLSGSLSRASGENVGSSYLISQGTLDNSNYSINWTGANFAINPRPITLTADAVTKVYGSADPALSVSLTGGSLGSATVSDTLADVTGTVGRTTGNNVGHYNVLLGTGAKAGNYAITFAADNNAFSVTPKTVSLSASKVYDGTDDLTGKVSISTGVGSETLSYTGATANDAHVATTGKHINAITLANATDGSGGLAGNYQLPATLDASTAPVTIVARNLTPTLANAMVNKVYDGTTNAPTGFIPSWTFSGLLDGDTSATLTATSAAYNNAHVAQANSFTVSGLAIAGVTGSNGSRASDYSLDVTSRTTGPGVASISKAPLTVTANNDARFVMQPDAAGYAGVSYSGFVNGETASVLGGTLKLTRNNAATTTAGSYSGVLQPSGLTADNYALSYVNGNYTIVGANQLLVRVNNLTSTYGSAQSYSLDSVEYFNGTNVVRLDDASVARSSVTINASNQVVVNDGANGLASFSLSPMAAALSGAGKLSVGSWQLGTSGAVSSNSQNFGNSVTVVGNHLVTPKAVTASASGVSKVYDGHNAVTSGTIGLTGSESGDVLGASGTGQYDTWNAGTGLSYRFVNVGLTGPDASNYYLSGGNSFTGSNGVITPRMVTLSASKVYDGTTSLTGNQVSFGGLVNGETLSHTGATTSDAHVATQGKYITAIALANATDGSGGLAANYQLPSLSAMNAPVTITPRTLTATLSNTGVSKMYDGTTNASTDFAATYSFSGLASGDTSASLAYVSALYNSANVADANTLTLSGLRIGGITGGNASAASDYVLDASSKSVQATIGKAELTVRANSDAKFEGENDPAGYAGVSYKGFVGGETSSVLGGTLAIARLNAANDTYAGNTYYGVLQASGLTAANYNLNYVNGDFSILGSNQLLVRVASVSNSYGTATTYNPTSVQYASDGTIHTLGSGGVAGSSVSINGSNQVSIIDGASGTANFTLGAVDGVTSGADKLTVGAWQLGTIGPVQVTGNNYIDRIVVVGNHQVQAKGVTASANGVSKVYDGNTAVTNGTLGVAGAESGDELNISGIGSYTAKNAGTTGYTYANLVLGGADAGNYYLGGGNSLSGSNGVISAKTLIASYTASDKVYDRSDAATVLGIANGLVAGDTVSLNKTSAAFDNKNVGENKTVTVSGIALDGADKNNYVLSSNTAQAFASITPKAIVISGITAANKVYNGNTVATVTAPSAPGWIEGDDVSVTVTGAFDNRNVGKSKTVTLTSQYKGTDLGNYSITDQTSTTADVTAKTVSLNLASITKVYDGQTAYNANASELQTLSNQLGVSGDAITSALLTFDTKDVGSNKDVTLRSVMLDDGNNGNNYLVTLGSNTASSITRRASVTWSGGATGNWFDPGNWAGAVPDWANVERVVIPAGTTVNFDTAGAYTAGVITGQPVSLLGLQGAGATLGLAAGTLSLGQDGATLAGLTQTGGALNSAGALTITQAFSQSAGTLSTSGAASHIDITQAAGRLSWTSISAGGNLTVRAPQVELGSTTVDGRLLSTTTGASADGGVTQSGPLTVKGNAQFVAETGTGQDAVLLAANDFQGTLSFTRANAGSWRHVSAHDINHLTLGNVQTNGDFKVTAGGDIGQDSTDGKKIVVGGSTDLSAGGNITLDGPNDFSGTVNATGSDVTLKDVNDITLGNINTDGDLVVDAGGDINQNSTNGKKIVVGGNTDLSAGGNIMLDGPNDFKGTVNATANNVTLKDVNDITLGNINAGGNLVVDAGGDIEQNSTNGKKIVVGGNTDLSAGGNITLNGPNDFNGTVSATGNDVTLKDVNAITLGNINAGGNLVVDAGGDIEQNSTNGKKIVVGGNTDLSAGGNITLDGPNDFNGTVSATGNDVTLKDVNDITLGNINAGGNLAVDAGGDIDQSSTNGKKIVVGGNTDLSAAGNITLDGPNDFKGFVYANGLNISLNDINDLKLGMVNASGNLAVRSNGNLNLGTSTVDGDLLADSGNGRITQIGAVQIAGYGTLAAGPNEILLTHPDNSFPKGVTVQASRYSITGDARKAAFEAAATVQSSLQASTAVVTMTSSTVAPQPLVLTSGNTSGASNSTSSSTASSAPASANSAGVTVDLQSASQQGVPLMVAVSLPKGASTVGTGFSFELPESVRSMVSEKSELMITQTNGSPLPAWLKFDQGAMRFEATAVPDSALPMQLVALVAGQRVTVVISERTE